MALAEEIADDLIETHGFNDFSFTATEAIREILIEAARAGGAASDLDKH